MGQNNKGFWNDEAVALAQRNHDRDTSAIIRKYEKRLAKERERHKNALKRLKREQRDILRELNREHRRVAKALVTPWIDHQPELPFDPDHKAGSQDAPATRRSRRRETPAPPAQAFKPTPSSSP
ncbi:hypothetical protein GCM10019059_39760 [Camelimonas fluminis]|uniref:Uncharacterized protein n=1 Tax=Camelimonas fluminis TaxID=1576911 RepID=A0ABV7UF65_9HYPH|nr:hypothetical protein [Camelimonas fluminis]GHE76536.1 hypothetical protein GCM10019059_39760 [Camelimonas fluminis]